MSLAQDLRNAWDIRDRDEFERLLTKLPTNVYAVPACSHPNQRFSDGPTTNQRNHWCPDCHASWTSFPDHASQAVMAASLGKPCTHQLLMTSGSAHGPHYARCLSCGKDMRSTLDQSEPGNQSNLPDHHSV